MVTNEAILIFGWSFSFEQFKKLIIPFIGEKGDEYYDDDGYLFLELFDKFEVYVNKNYPGITADRTCPYYDCYPEDNIFYITVKDVSDIKGLFREWDSDIPSDNIAIRSIIQLMPDIGIRNPPDVEALINIY